MSRPWYQGMSFEQIEAALANKEYPGADQPAGLIEVPFSYPMWASQRRRVFVAGPANVKRHPAALSTIEERFYELARTLWANHDDKSMDALSLIAAARTGLFGQGAGASGLRHADRYEWADPADDVCSAERFPDGYNLTADGGHIEGGEAAAREILRLAEENKRLNVSALAHYARGSLAEREAACSYLRGHAEEALDSTTRAALFWAAEHIESGDHLAQETLPEKEEE